jgi:hypothetical protein
MWKAVSSKPTLVLFLSRAKWVASSMIGSATSADLGSVCSGIGASVIFRSGIGDEFGYLL